MYTWMMISRNKDNKDIEGFKQRTKLFITTDSSNYSNIEDDMLCKFDEFVFQGIPGEICRLYRSVNERDEDKVRKEFIIKFIRDEPKLDNIKNVLYGIANKPECRLTSHWLLDVDTENQEKICDVRNYINDSHVCNILEEFTTPNGAGIIIDHGFDTREFLSKFDYVSVKKDDMKFISACQKVN